MCPDCRNRLADRESCRICGGSGTVCPGCRGSRWVMRGKPGPNARLKPCDCMVPVLVDGKESHRPDAHREVDMILRYRDELQRDEDSIPF